MNSIVLGLVLVVSAAGLAALARWLRRVDQFQSSLRVRVITAGVGALLVLGIGGIFLVRPSLSLAMQRNSLLARLNEADRSQKEPISTELIDEGSVTVGGMKYFSPRVKALAPQLFDQRTGKVVRSDLIAELLLRPQVPEWAPPMIQEPGTVIMVVLVGATLLAGAVLLQLGPLLAAVGLSMLAGGSIAIYSGNLGSLLALIGMAVLITGFGVLSRLVLLLLSWSGPTFAVAHTVLRESTRRWYTGAFVLAILVLLPLIPLGIEPQQALRYRVQTFIGWSLGSAFALAGLLTLVLSCATVALEIRDRQIWQTLTKPVHRLSYIIGKWLGVASVNLVLLLVTGLSIFLFVQYMRTQRGIDSADELAVRDEVLVARVGAKPDYKLLTREQVTAAVDQLIEADPTLKSDMSDGRKDESEVRRTLGEQVRRENLAQQRSIPPNEFRTYKFKGLDAAKSQGSAMALRYTFHIGASDPHETDNGVIFRFKDQSWTEKIYIPAQGHVLVIDRPDLIDEDGTFEVEVGNITYRPELDPPFIPGKSNLLFDPDGFELLYKVGGFETNFFRAILLQWTKLCFLAMLGICAATVLSFPVALLFSATVFLIGMMTPFLKVALDNYWVDDKSPALIQAFQILVRSIAMTMNFLLSPFGETSGDTLLVEGRLVSWVAVAKSLFWLGVAWSGFVLLVGWTAFRRKEIAIYSGQGG